MQTVPEFSPSIQDLSRLIGQDPFIVQTLKMTVDGLLVLNDRGEILEANQPFLDMLRLTDKSDLIGQRPGDAIGCLHTSSNSSCGSGGYCSTCGAAIAIMSSLEGEVGREMKCVASLRGEAGDLDLCLKVRAYPFFLQGQKLVFLFVQDVTEEEWRIALEQVFFHDLNNILTGLFTYSSIVEQKLEQEQRAAAAPLKFLISRLFHEINLQKYLSTSNRNDYQVEQQLLGLDMVIDEISHFFASHPVARGKNLHLPPRLSGITLKSDLTLLNRVLVNMLKNAFEATSSGGDVRMTFERDGGEWCFQVWNEGHIPAALAPRVFQRHFSTKNEPGRGFGTYSMKILAERFLNARVEFSSSPDDGTLFSLRIPAT